MKKKIAIVFNRMIVGGAEKALLNFLNALDKERYDITLFTLDDKGAYFDEIPSEIDVQFTKVIDVNELLINDLKKCRLNSYIRNLFHRICIRLCRNEYKKIIHSMHCLPKFPGQFDCVMAYKLNYEDTATAVCRINAAKRCVVVHSSVGKTPITDDNYIAIACKYFDRFFCVSEELKNDLSTIWHGCIGKASVLHNIMPIEDIMKLAEIKIGQTFPKFSIATVGRLSSEKGQQMIPETARMLVDAGYDIHWYLVGDGPLREEVERESEKHGVSDHVILLGTQSNPYPYIKNCDIYVQPSFSEGWGLTVQEARILHKPIVTTPVPVFGEQIVSGENGLIVDEMTPKALFDGIKTLIDHTEMREKFVENLEKEDHDGSKELQKLYDFIEG